MLPNVATFSDKPTSIRLTEEQRQMLDTARKSDILFHDRSDSWLIRYAVEQTFKPLLKKSKEIEGDTEKG